MADRQLSLFSYPESRSPVEWTLYVDGAARSNPGPAGAGIYLLKDGLPMARKGFFLGKKTNNQAEYLALLLGLFVARKYLQLSDRLKIVVDSELLVKQLTGEYAIKNAELKKLYAKVTQLLKGVSYTIEHVARKSNSVADKLANQGIDRKTLVPAEFLNVWNIYE